VREIEAARQGAGEIPVLVGSGLSSSNAAALLRVADGAIVGTSLKRDDGIDREKVRELLREVRR
jgi:predicted TIM-barrel enzyme